MNNIKIELIKLIHIFSTIKIKYVNLRTQKVF
jgi:hypothetical protein